MQHTQSVLCPGTWVERGGISLFCQWLDGLRILDTSLLEDEVFGVGACWSSELYLRLWCRCEYIFLHIFSYSFHHFSGLTMMTNHGQQLSGRFCRFQLVQCQCGVGCVALCCCMSFYIGDGNSRTTEFLYLCDMRYSGSLVFVLAVRMNRKRVLVLFAFNWSFRIVRIQTCNIIQLYYTCNILIIIEFY